MHMVSIQAIILTADIQRLLDFYTSLFDATEVARIPAEGPAFYVGVRIGDSTLGLVDKAEAEPGSAQRILLSIDVENVDDFLSVVGPAGGQVRSQANDMPWGQRVLHIQDPDGNAVNLTHSIPPVDGTSP